MLKRLLYCLLIIPMYVSTGLLITSVVLASPIEWIITGDTNRLNNILQKTTRKLDKFEKYLKE
jgi:hypothetical protein